MVLCFPDEIMGKFMGHGSSAFVSSVCKPNQRTNKWFSCGPSLHHPHNLFDFVHKIWMLWKQNWGLVNKKFYILILSLQEILICEGCEFFPIDCNIIGHSQRRLVNLNFNHQRGNSHLLGIFILSLWMWVISIMQIAFHGWKRKLWNKVNNKLNYQQTTIV
jgi:hypothetical protein